MTVGERIVEGRQHALGLRERRHGGERVRVQLRWQREARRSAAAPERSAQESEDGLAFALGHGVDAKACADDIEASRGGATPCPGELES